MTILDISRILEEGMATYPLNPPYARALFRDVPEESSALSRLTLGTHTGTHVDAPRHVFAAGAGIGEVPLGRLVGPAVVVDLTAVAEVITGADLARVDLPAGHAVLLKTRNSAADPRTFDEHFVACEESAARLLADRSVRAVGVDGPSIKKFRVQDRTHHLILERGIPIIEGLDLSGASSGSYTLVCLPLRLAGADGAPARAILISDAGKKREPSKG